MWKNITLIGITIMMTQRIESGFAGDVTCNFISGAILVGMS